MAKLGALDLGTVTVDGQARERPHRRPDDRRPARRRAPRRRHDHRRRPVHGPAPARRSSGSSWLFTRANGIVDMHRWIPWVSRKRRFERPNHGDPFVTPVSPRVTVRIRTDVPLGVRQHRRRSSPPPTAAARRPSARPTCGTSWSRRRPTTARRRRQVGDTEVRVISRPGFPAARDARRRGERAAQARGPARPLPVPGAQGRPVGRRLRHGGPGRRLDPDRHAVGATSPTSSPTRSRTSGSTGSSATTRPASRSPTRPPPTSSRARSPACGAAPAARRDDLDRSIYRYSSTCYYEVVYIQGGNLLDDARERMGSKPFWAALRGYLADHRWGLTAHADAARRPRRRDAAQPARASWRSRFPSLY